MFSVKPLLLVIGALLLSQCAKAPVEAPDRPTTVMYVGAEELPIHAQPNETSSMVSTYRQNEAVSVLSKGKEWSEISITLDQSGWARTELLSGTKQDESTSSPSTPRFKVAPLQVYNQSGAHGEIVLEASVNTDGQVVDVKTLANTTGSSTLEALNRDAIQKARFYPMFLKGKGRAFLYEYKVTY